MVCGPSSQSWRYSNAFFHHALQPKNRNANVMHLKSGFHDEVDCYRMLLCEPQEK